MRSRPAILAVAVVIVLAGVTPYVSVASAQTVDETEILIEGGEDESTVELKGDTAQLSLINDSETINGTHTLQLSGSGFASVASDGATYNRTPSTGDLFTALVEVEEANDKGMIRYATQSATSAPDGYRINLDANNDRIKFDLRQSGADNNLKTVNATINADTVYQVRVNWTNNNVHKVSVVKYFPDEVIASFNVTDSTFSSGGIGFEKAGSQDGGTAYFDDYKIVNETAVNVTANTSGTSGGGDVSGTVRNQNGHPVENATVTVTGIDRANIDADPAKIEERINEIREQITNAKPPEFSMDKPLTGGDGLFTDASTSYIAAHPKGDWGLTAFQDEPRLGNPRVQLPANEEIALSVWDPTQTGLAGFQDGVNGDLPGGVVDDTAIVVESIDHAGGTVDTRTIETDTTYDVALGGTHDLAVTTLPAGFYRVYPEGSPETAYVIVVGDPQEIVGSIRADLRDQKGQLTAQAKEVREYLDRDVLKQYTTTTNADGEFSVNVPDSVTRVSVQAHKAPPGLDQDPTNVSLQDVREFYAVTEYNGSYVMPAEAGTYSVPANDITVDVVEAQAPQFADLGRFQNATERFQNLLQNLSYSDLPSSIQERLGDLDRERLEEMANDLQRLTNENSQLEARVEELMDRDLSEIDINDSTNAELREQVQAQQQAISELRSTIESSESSAEVANGVANSTATFAESLTGEQVRVIAQFPNGTSKEVPSEYLSVDQSAATIVGEGGTQIQVEDYPVGDASGVQFAYQVATENGVGKTSTSAFEPGADAPGLDALSLSTLRPGPDEQVDVTLVGDDETQITNITNARAVGPNGNDLETTTEGADTMTFTTAGEGRHYVEVTFQTASGEEGTLTHRIAAGETDQAMPPGIRIKDTPFGTIAVVGDGYESGSASTSNGGTQLDVAAQIGADADAPARTHLYAHATDLPPSASLNVNIVRGEDQRAVQRHVEVTAHLPAITSETPTLYRGDSALPRDGEGQIASVTTSADETTIVTVTDASGSLQLQTNSNPGIVERAQWWIDRNTPEFSLGVLGQLPAPPTLPLDVSGALGWVGPVQAATPAPTIDTPTPALP